MEIKLRKPMLIPPGFYRAVVVGCNFKKVLVREQEIDSLEFQFRITHGKYAGEILRSLCSPLNTLNSRFHRWIQALGIVLSPDATSFDTDMALGRPCVLIVDQVTKAGNVYSRVQDIRAISFLETIGAEQNAAETTSSQVNPTVPVYNYNAPPMIPGQPPIMYQPKPIYPPELPNVVTTAGNIQSGAGYVPASAPIPAKPSVPPVSPVVPTSPASPTVPTAPATSAPVTPPSSAMPEESIEEINLDGLEF